MNEGWKLVHFAPPLVVGLLFAVELVLPNLVWVNLSVHAAVEAAGGVAALQLAALLALSPVRAPGGPAMRLAPGLAAMGVLDLFHAAAAPGDLFVWLHSLASLAGGALFVLAWVETTLPVRGMTLGALAVACVVGTVYSLVPGLVPVMVAGGHFTPFAIQMHVVAAVGFFVSSSALLRPSVVRQPALGAVAILLGLAALLFPLSSLWNLQWWYWHAVRLAGYMLAFGFLVESSRRAHEALESEVAVRTVDLRAAIRDLESFSYTVSHDLRAPLRAIDGFTTLVLGEATLEPASREHLERVRAAAKRMSELIDDLLHLSRVSRQTLGRIPVDLAAVAAEIVADLRLAEPGRHVDVVIEPGLTASADPGLARIVLENLLSNAWKFTSRRTDGRIEVGLEVVCGEPAFFVRDNGAGFDMAHVDRLFIPFERLHSQGFFPGTGIGLATVRRIVERHGGRVWAEGAPGEGATFWFTLPTP